MNDGFVSRDCCGRQRTTRTSATGDKSIPRDRRKIQNKPAALSAIARCRHRKLIRKKEEEKKKKTREKRI